MPNNEIKVQVEKTIDQILQQDVRLPMSKMQLKKTGYNKHLNYYYFDLPDFMPQATELFAKTGICPVYNIIVDREDGIEKAIITLIKGTEKMTFQMPTADVPNMNGVFNLGSKDTYCFRFLMVKHVLMLSESDPAEINNTDSNAPIIEEKKATAKQVEMIKYLYDEDNQAKMLEYYKIEKLEDLSIKDASQLIQRKKG